MKKTILFLTILGFGTALLSCQSDDTSDTSKNSVVNPTNENQTSEVTSSVAEENENMISSNEISTESAKKTTKGKLPKGEENATVVNDEKSGSMSFDEVRIPPAPSIMEEPEEKYDFHEYERWDNMLRSNVSSSGKVNYTSFKKDAATLDSVIKEFQDNYPGSGWSSTQKMTYWINAYNLFTIKLIVDNYPVSSITKITAKPWEKKFIQLGGKTYDLNTIENGIIRKQFNEPRVHFALNCASESCPILLNRAYTPTKLYGQLTTQTKKFLNDGSKNDFSDPNSIKISSIFDWYGEDFKKSGTVVDFINKYRTEQLSNPKIGYMTYSWDLND